MILVIFL